MGIAFLVSGIGNGLVNTQFGEAAWLQSERLVLVQVVVVPLYAVMYTLGVTTSAYYACTPILATGCFLAATHQIWIRLHRFDL
ncbi:MAG: hypothetical protein KKD01_06450 [Proteobacteria bacterium]|nr:hypothetical protein [Pseudomonadota bacterium]MBU1138052.1 hypothetical protein [Pseudomonadota bacterium]MBU1233635.1 hypothetical protein [Pseudomonadota bacterium]MBU1420342.1 hypothetical protein [Pseudomonadota bacterium]MBU1454352.1 hypothetical protein [Pseudomonadota bacterium]